MPSDEDIEYVLHCVRERAGLDMSIGKRYLVVDRLGKLASARGSHPKALIAGMRGGDGDLCNAIIEAMCIHETCFFRDSWFIGALQNEVIPRLLSLRASERRIAIWSAACSTGQEVWSIAILLEQFPQLQDWEIVIVGSDISTFALQQAVLGCYSQREVARGLSAEQLSSYFERQGDKWIVQPKLRRRVHFRPLNLVKDWKDMPYFDLVLMRNVLIYFDDETKGKVLQRVQNFMRRDGFLFLGGCESPLGLVDGFSYNKNGSNLYYQLRQGL